MSGNCTLQHDRSLLAFNPSNPSTSRPRGWRRSFETLDDRLVLSAVPTAFAADTAGVGQDELVAGFNNPPMGTDASVMMSGSTFTFTSSDFGFSDPDDVPPDLMLGVVVTSLPPEGTLTANGSGVAPGQFIPIADLDVGELQFTTSGVEDFSHASFTFQVQDAGGTAEGGSDLDPSPNTFTLVFDSDETNFVRGLYQDLFGRSPDTEGLTDWLDSLSAGVSRLDVATALWETPEHRGIQVDGFYQQFFGREADAGGRQFWINAMLGGMSEETVMASFMTTVEYQILNPSDESFVIAVYADLFARAPDAADQDFWVNALATGQLTQGDVAQMLVDTRERHLQLVDSYYEDFLNRQPDSEGLFFWTGQLDDNLLDDQAVAQMLLATPEYFSLQH
jgi:hypothetical protein